MTDTLFGDLDGVTVCVIPADDEAHKTLAYRQSLHFEALLAHVAERHGEGMALDALVMAYVRVAMTWHQLEGAGQFARALSDLTERLKSPLNAMAADERWSAGEGIALYTTAPPHPPVAGFVRGAFAVHAGVGGAEDGFVLTHLPTGSALVQHGEQDGLMALADRLAALDCDWSWTDPHSEEGRKAIKVSRPYIAPFRALEGDDCEGRA